VDNLAQELQSLASRIGPLAGQASDVAARLATRPLPTGSPAVANTMGITDVACFAARTVGVYA
jgi:hypothetical protein